jgi:hypothetical protein
MKPLPRSFFNLMPNKDQKIAAPFLNRSIVALVIKPRPNLVADERLAHVFFARLCAQKEPNLSADCILH